MQYEFSNLTLCFSLAVIMHVTSTVEYTEVSMGTFRDYLKELPMLPGFSGVYCYSHNGARFDTHLVLKAFTDVNHVTENLVMKGSSIIEATINSGTKEWGNGFTSELFI